MNYIDRAVLGVLKPLLDEELGWTQKDYGWMVTAFQASYAAGYLLAGRLFDRIGVRVGFLFAVTLWSLAAVAHAAARSVVSFSVARSFLGLAEGGCFPGAIKAVTDWFPKEQRAFATGLFNAGSNVGRHHLPDGGAVAGGELGLARRVHRHRRGGICLGGRVGLAVSIARETSPRFGGGTGLHPQRPGRAGSQRFRGWSCCVTGRCGPS